MTVETIEIIEATREHSADWAYVFLEAIKDCQWMTKYLESLEIKEMDVSLSFFQDIQKKTEYEDFIIAYIKNEPVGIIRLDKYWVPDSMKVLSHFPLVISKYQRKGIGTLLVKEGIKRAYTKGITDVWMECWSKDKSEITDYEGFYRKIGFESKSDRLEMSVQLEKSDFSSCPIIEGLHRSTTEKITEELIEAISSAYAKSNDILHSIEKLYQPNIAQQFLEQTKTTFEQLGFYVESNVYYYNSFLCAGLLSAKSKNKALVLEVGVIPEYRKKGIAQHIICEFIEEMKQEGVHEVVLGVDTHNVPAISLYKKLGFRRSWFGNIMQFTDKKKLGL
jgi:ribosomal protein S18 acetylase RimI-like enzyme